MDGVDEPVAAATRRHTMRSLRPRPFATDATCVQGSGPAAVSSASTGRRPEPVMVREVLRDAKQMLGHVRRRFDHVIQMLRGRGVNL